MSKINAASTILKVAPHLQPVGIVLGLCLFNLGGCSEMATLPEQQTYGPHPTLVAPNPTLIPTVNTAAAKGWPYGVTPTPAPGLAVRA
ncbi:MAG: hypothetical protein ACXU7H_09725, partial [Burkholderiaceae bacterium]